MSRSGSGRNGAPTIYDIAEAAGVNPSTVSRALGKPGRVAAATVERIEQAARSLNYQANPIARALHSGRTQTVGLIVADLLNPVYFEVVRGAQSAAAAGNYTLLLAQSVEDPATELLAAQRLAGTVDGLILVTSRLEESQIRLLAAHKPVVAINREISDVLCIAPDASDAINQAIAHLARYGHQRVGYVPGPERSWASGQRADALARVAAQHGISLEIFERQNPHRLGGAASLEEIFSSSVSAVFMYNDLMAIGLMQECGERGIRVPEDLSIIGFDDIFGADFTTPALSSVRFPLYGCGAEALRILVRCIETGEYMRKTPEFGSELMIRGSTGPKINGQKTD